MRIKRASRLPYSIALLKLRFSWEESMTRQVLIGLIAAGFLGINSYWVVQFGAISASVMDASLAIASIKSQNFTQEDGLDVWQEIARIQEQVAITGAQLDMHLDIH